jgi:hypothetical protein
MLNRSPYVHANIFRWYWFIIYQNIHVFSHADNRENQMCMRHPCSIHNEHSWGGWWGWQRRWFRFTFRCWILSRPSRRWPENVSNGCATAKADQDHRTVASRAQWPLLDTGQTQRQRGNGQIHPVSGADLWGHQAVDRNC